MFKPENEEEWHEFRRQHLTSTELRDLHLSRTANKWQELRKQKETGKRWGGNRYTEWGTAREPILAPLVVEVDSRLVYNADPQTIIINPDDDRLCGTPDLFSEDGEVIGEIKTAKRQFTGGRFHDWCPDGYYLQVQANMWHTGAEACVLLVEYYQEQGGEFSPVEYEYRVIDYDPKIVEDMQATANEWFAWLEGTAPDWMGEITGLDQVDDVTDLVAQYAMLTAEVDDRKKRIAKLKAEILELTGDSHTGDYGGYHLTVSTTQPSKVFDTRVFKAAHPHLYNEFRTKTRAGSTRLTIKEQ
ncbi:YqaJ viral recombinase family protein [Corynebacterium striatum]|uniref:YqaJ viral recombinase family protein n=1 Tax=Corynebacterium striatum TaxID=43770 RepID=UPI0015592939|nr:YqaJ viral recombinase family protein [Corynebacterium striatum]